MVFYGSQPITKPISAGAYIEKAPNHFRLGAFLTYSFYMISKIKVTINMISSQKLSFIFAYPSIPVLFYLCCPSAIFRATVYSCETSLFPELVYEGKYEDLDPAYYNRTVSHFAVDKLHDPGYNNLIDHMNIYLSREGC